MKTEPNADMRAMAALMWQMYTAMIDEGFTEDQAMTIISDMLCESLRNNNSND